MGKKQRTRIKQRPAVGALGKVLTRRSKGICELCESRSKVRPFELPPFPEEPDPERSLMACERCRQWLGSGTFSQVEGRFVEQAVWDPRTAVRLAAGRLLLSGDLGDRWVRDQLDVVRIDVETGELLDT